MSITVSRSPPAVTQQFYRRPLPSCCISFCSDEGKTIFREALMAGHMETYFTLAAQFCTQEEPAFCGLSTLVMVLNALEVDPKKVWKGPWRWYHEQMLDCCVPLEVIEKSGITFDQFACLAICNTLDVQMQRVDARNSIGEFRSLVADKTRCADEVVVVSYSRRTLEQTGDGHFSPLGGYHPTRDLVLIFDVARFKYPPHWVSIKLLYEAMMCVDKATDLPRGYIWLKKSPSRPTILFRFSTEVSVTCSVRKSKSTTMADVMRCVDAWQSYLDEPWDCDCSPDSSDRLLQRSLDCLVETLESHGHEVILLTTQVECSDGLDEAHRQAVADLLHALESLPLFSLVSSAVSSRTANGRKSGIAPSESQVANCGGSVCHASHCSRVAAMITQEPGSRTLVPGTQSQESGSSVQVQMLCTPTKVPGSPTQVPCSSAQVCGLHIQTPRTPTKVSGSPAQASPCLHSLALPGSQALDTLTQGHYLTMLMLLWPYSEQKPDSQGARLAHIVGAQLDVCAGGRGTNGAKLLQNEVRQLRQQLGSVLGYVVSCCRCPCLAQSAARKNSL